MDEIAKEYDVIVLGTGTFNPNQARELLFFPTLFLPPLTGFLFSDREFSVSRLDRMYSFWVCESITMTLTTADNLVMIED